MRRALVVAFTVLFLFTLCSCGNVNLASLTDSDQSKGTNASSSDISEQPTMTSPEPTEELAPAIDNAERGEIFRSFLSENYQVLTDSFYGGIAGIGFLDLDRDGGIEMLIFDAGASAAMGVQFFDIIDNQVACVSANLESVKDSFGNKQMSDVIVNANYFDDFRLMKDKTTGDEFFIVESGNGAADFSYSELVLFGSNKGTLTLKSLMYKHDDYDIDTGELTGQSFKIDGIIASKAEYDKEYKNFFSALETTDFVSQGVFMWEGTGYETNYNGLMDMVNKALDLIETNT